MTEILIYLAKVAVSLTDFPGVLFALAIAIPSTAPWRFGLAIIAAVVSTAVVYPRSLGYELPDLAVKEMSAFLFWAVVVSGVRAATRAIRR
jgi:hypothetical protein